MIGLGSSSQGIFLVFYQIDLNERLTKTMPIGKQMRRVEPLSSEDDYALAYTHAEEVAEKLILVH